MPKMPVTPLEIRRQILHIVLGITLVFFLERGYLNSWGVFWILVAGIILSWFSLRYRIPVVGWCLDKFERKQNRPGKGAITYFIGVLLALELFAPDIAYASILVLAIGDGVSSLVGPFGKWKTKLSDKKLLEGTLAGGIFGGIGASFFVAPPLAFVASFLAMFFEAMEIRFNQKLLNDNVIVPLVAGTAITLMRGWGWFV